MAQQQQQQQRQRRNLSWQAEPQAAISSAAATAAHPRSSPHEANDTTSPQHGPHEANDAANARSASYEASEASEASEADEVDEVEVEDALFQDNSDIEATHEASETGDAATGLFNPYEASEADEAEAEDVLFQYGDDDSDIEAAYEDEAVDIDVDMDVDMDIDRVEAERSFQSDKDGELQSDAYDSGEDTDSTINSDDSYGAADDEPAASVSSYEEVEDEDTPSEASELGLEAQLQQELRQSEDAELDLPLQLGLHLLDSFSCDGHADSYEQHWDAQEEENHWSLEDLNRSTQRLPDILGSPSILPHNSEHRQRSYDWARLFEGRSHEQHSSADESSLDSDSDGSNDQPATVCLACSEQPARTNEVQYDIDSIIGFAQSLAFAQQGLYLNFAPQFHQNLHTNVHLTLPVIDHSSGRARTKHVPLFKVPHIRLGRVVGAEGISVFIFFPAQWSAEKPTNFPGKLGGRSYGVLEQWTDAILLPSLASCISSDVAQHLPPSLVLALLRARARNHEQQARTSKQDFLHQSLHHFVQGRLLAAMWDEVVRRCQLPENALFARPHLVFSSKGTKLLYKDRTIAGAWDLFQQGSRHYLNHDHLDPERVWVDLGKEVACTDWAFAVGDPARDRTGQPQVYLWRRCCIEHLATWMRFGQPAAARPKMKVTRFTPAMLGDSLEATFEFARTSPQRTNGWIYS